MAAADELNEARRRLYLPRACPNCGKWFRIIDDIGKYECNMHKKSAVDGVYKCCGEPLRAANSGCCPCMHWIFGRQWSHDEKFGKFPYAFLEDVQGGKDNPAICDVQPVEQQRKGMASGGGLSLSSVLERVPKQNDEAKTQSDPREFEHHAHVKIGKVGLPEGLLAFINARRSGKALDPNKTMVVYKRWPDNPAT